MESTSTNKTQLVYEYVRKGILSGDRVQGQRIVTTQVARELGTSQIPVREALRQLEAEGLVEIRDNIGASVTRLDIHSALDIILLQSVVEALATRLAAPYVTPMTIEHLEETIRCSEQAIATEDFVEFGRLNRQFHAIIYDVCPSRTVRNEVNALLGHHQALRQRSLFTVVPERAIESFAEHCSLVNLLKSTPQDLDLIEGTARAHKLRFVQRVAAHNKIPVLFLRGMKF